MHRTAARQISSRCAAPRAQAMTSAPISFAASFKPSVRPPREATATSRFFVSTRVQPPRLYFSPQRTWLWLPLRPQETGSCYSPSAGMSLESVSPPAPPARTIVPGNSEPPHFRPAPRQTTIRPAIRSTGQGKIGNPFRPHGWATPAPPVHDPQVYKGRSWAFLTRYGLFDHQTDRAQSKDRRLSEPCQAPSPAARARAFFSSSCSAKA